MGAGIELLYEVLSQRPEQLREYADAIARGAARKWDIPYIPTDWLEEQALRAPIRLLVGLVEQGLKEASPSRGSRLRRRAGGGAPGAPRGTGHAGHDARVRLLSRARPPLAPPRAAHEFVFGHTHKPFATVLESMCLDLRCAAEDLGDPGKQRPGSSAGAEIELPVTVYNLGGWVIDTEDPEPLHGAAALLLVEALDAVWLLLYREGKTCDEAADERRRLATEKSPFAGQIVDRADRPRRGLERVGPGGEPRPKERADRLRERVDAARTRRASGPQAQAPPTD